MTPRGLAQIIQENVYGKSIKPGINFGVRNSFADIAGTIADILGIEFETVGLSFKDIIYLT